MDLNPETIDQRIRELKVEMKEASRGLDFEKAAKIRDEIKAITEARLLL